MNNTAVPIAFNTPYYTAVTRVGNTVNVYFNTTRIYTGTFATGITDSSDRLALGARQYNHGAGLEGYLHAARITKGHGRGMTGSTIAVPTELWPTS